MPKISDVITVGFELECAGLSSQAPVIIQNRGFQHHYDASITGPNGESLPRSRQFEIKSSPQTIQVTASQDGNFMRLDYGDSLNVLRDLLKTVDNGAMNKSCGFHVHFGRPDRRTGRSKWEPERVRTFLGIGMMLEQTMFGLVPPSRTEREHCRPIAALFTSDDLRSYYPTGSVAVRKDSNRKRHCWMNLIETRRGDPANPTIHNGLATGTVEIRLLGNVKRFDYVTAWVRLWAKIAALVAYVPSSLAVMHCCFAESIKPEIMAVAQAKAARPTTLPEYEEI